MSSPNGTRGLVVCRIGDLWVDPQVQRTLNKARVAKMAADFSPDALGVLTTSLRREDRTHIIDGQHRYRAAEAAGYTGPIQTMQYVGLTIPQEAALFRKLNTTAKPTLVDSFLVACIEEDPDALYLARVINDNGWTLGNATANGRMSAIGSLQRVYALSPTAAAAALSTITAAWGHEAAGVQGALIEGLGRMFARYGDLVNLKEMAKRLAAYPGGAAALLGYARGQSLVKVGNLSAQVAWAATNLYNKGRRTNALPAWQ